MDTGGYTPGEPIAAIATALAPAALGVVRCSGRDCVRLAARLFSRPNVLLGAAGNTVTHGWIADPSSAPPRRIDEVLVSVFRAPRSFTGEEMVEISCHGGTAVVTEIFRLLCANGFRSASRGEFTFRAFINGKADLTRAEAVQEIISARTDKSRGRAAGRLAGSLHERIDGIKASLVEVLASIEAEIEYPEDEEAIADAFDDTRLRSVLRELEDLCASWASERLYQDGARIVLCGRTNAGKSSLFNTLLKEERAIVSDIHGTTRDWIESWASFDGIPARLFDTAGLRETEDAVEMHGVRRALDLAQEADLVLYVVDSAAGLAPEDVDFLRKAAPSEGAGGKPGKRTPVVVVLNKCDLADSAAKSLAARLAGKGPFLPAATVCVSARTGCGTAALVEAVRSQLTSAAGQERDLPGLGSARQKRCAEEAARSVRHALKAAGEGYTLDAVAQDMEDALGSLGEITGGVTPDDILGTVFSRFCLGK